MLIVAYAICIYTLFTSQMVISLLNCSKAWVNLPHLISGEQKSNGGLVHPYLKGFDESKRVSDTRLLEGLLTVLSFTLFSPGYAVRFPKLSARQRPKPMLIGR